MLRIYYSNNRNSHISCEPCLEQYPERPQPHYSYFNNLDRNLGLFGSFGKLRNSYGQRMEAEDEEAVLNATSSERSFDQWVKTIAIELIRQTPLYDIKYLDILTLAECWKQKDKYEKDCNFNNITSTNCYSCEECSLGSTTATVNNCHPSLTTPYVTQEIKDTKSSCDTVDGPRPNSNVDVEDLLKKCQNVESYVPVKQKLVLFESLCRLGRKVRSTEDVSFRVDVSTKKARSLHDLSNLQTHIAVREICKYFENKNEDQENKKHVIVRRTNPRLNNSDSQVEIKTRLRPFHETLNRVT